MEFLIISGMSGAGKSRAADILEDLDFYCVDNMPVALLPKFAELCLATRGRYERVALVTDVREKESFDELWGSAIRSPGGGSPSKSGLAPLRRPWRQSAASWRRSGSGQTLC